MGREEELYQEEGLHRQAADIAKRTAGYYAFILAPRKWSPWLREHVPYYGEIEAESEKGFLRLYGREKRTAKTLRGSLKAAREHMKERDILTAYERLWSGQNRPARVVNKAVYRFFGGNKNPVAATLGTFAYSGFALHALNPLNPYTLPSYAAGYWADGGEGLGIAAAAITGLHALLGLPVAYKKWKDSKA